MLEYFDIAHASLLPLFAVHVVPVHLGPVLEYDLRWREKYNTVT
jgi:hypothetical protein